MRKTPFKKKYKPMKRTKLRKKSKTELAKLKEELWQLCRKIIKVMFPHICYTCGKKLEDGAQDFHIGHFISSSICSAFMRYYLDNLRPQCSGCNVWKSGNWLEFEYHLKRDKGENFVVELKKLNEQTKGKKYDIIWYKNRIEEYKIIYQNLIKQ